MEHLLHLLSLSSSAGGILNLSALVLGLAALAFSLRALLRALAGRSIAGPLAIGGGARRAARRYASFLETRGSMHRAAIIREFHARRSLSSSERGKRFFR